MGSINKSHIEDDGSVLLFNGELVLLYCDSVSCEVGGKESFKGRVYLTTHRLMVVISPYRRDAPVKSFCAPFCAITKCGVEQPVFGANYIEATVRDETDPSKSFSFKLKFNKGGAIEMAMTMNRAVQFVGRNYNQSMPPPPAYTPSPSAQYYQAPPTVYAPGYNSGIPMPTQQFPDQPPIGFIYASEAPPPYPGIGGQVGQQQTPRGPPSYGPQYPSSQIGAGYPGQQQQQPWGFGQQGYPQGPAPPGQQQPPQSGGYPSQAYPNQQQAWSGYPSSQGPTPTSTTGGYPSPQGPAPTSTTGGYPSPQGPAPTSTAGGYPSPQGPAPTSTTGGYPSPQGPAPTSTAGGYPNPQGPAPTPTTGGYPGAGNQQQQQQPQSSAGYPDLSIGGSSGPQPAPTQQQYPQQQQGASGQAWPSAPSFNPNWQNEK